MQTPDTHLQQTGFYNVTRKAQMLPSKDSLLVLTFLRNPIALVRRSGQWCVCVCVKVKNFCSGSSSSRVVSEILSLADLWPSCCRMTAAKVDRRAGGRQECSFLSSRFLLRPNLLQVLLLYHLSGWHLTLRVWEGFLRFKRPSFSQQSRKFERLVTGYEMLSRLVRSFPKFKRAHDNVGNVINFKTAARNFPKFEIRNYI
jgi:hypothetical protein